MPYTSHRYNLDALYDITLLFREIILYVIHVYRLTFFLFYLFHIHEIHPFLLWPCQDLGTGSGTAGSGSKGKEGGRAIAMETMWLAYR